MKSKNTVLLFISVLIGCLWGTPPAALAAPGTNPRLTSSSIRYGFSLRIPPNSWAFFEYQLDNPDTVKHKVKLVLRPMGQRNMTIYETELTLLPGFRFRSGVMVSVGTVETYTVELYMNGNLLMSDDLRLRMGMVQQRVVMFLNDDLDLSYGAFSKNPALGDSYISSFVRAQNMPMLWAGYDRVYLLVVMRPDVDRMSARQMKALIAFVVRGGSVLFCNPKGIMDVSRTPLAKLLPILPLRIRPLDRLDAFKKVGGHRVEWPKGVDFLESVPRGDGITTLKHGDFPLVRWQKYGLGRVGVCTVNPSDKAVVKAGSFNPIWRHLLSFGGRVEYVSSIPNTYISKALDALTGIEIPRREWVRNCILGYLGLVLLFVFTGIAVRRRGLSWLALVGLAILATIAIFFYAAKRMSKMSENSAAVLAFHAENTSCDAEEQVISLFSKREQTLTLRGTSVDCQIRGLLPPPKKFGLYGGGRNSNFKFSKVSRKKGRGKGKKLGVTRSALERRVDRRQDEVVRDVLTINRTGGISAMNQLLLRQYAPKSYSTLFSGPAKVWKKQMAYPLVRWEPGRVTMAEWTIPESIGPVIHAALLCENGYIPVQLKENRCRIDFNGEIRQITTASPEISALRNCLLAVRSPAPSLVLFTEVHADNNGGVPENFDVSGRRVWLVPVTQELSARQIQLPPQRFRLNTAHGIARMLRFGRDWAPVNQRSKENEYAITTSLPAEFQDLRVSRIQINFVADNRGRNLTFELRLRPFGEKTNGRDIQGKQQEDGSFLFSNLDSARLIDPSNGQFTIILISRTIKKIRDPISAMRVNTWRIQQFDLRADGELPPDYAGKF